MTTPTLLILRPEPGARQTAARAADQGWRAIVAPIFDIEPVAWEAPDPSNYDALIVTSANAVRQAGPQLATYAQLPVHAVGGATAAALRAAGFTDIRPGQGDAAALLLRAAADGIGRALHLAGMDHRDARHPAIRLDRRIVYRSVPRDRLDDALIAAIAREETLALLHSGRAAAHFAALCEAAGVSRAALRIAALAPAILDAAGPGWAAAIAADTPDDMALLAAAARMCH